MILTLIRYKGDSACTLGKIYIDGAFHCYSLEDAFRQNKIKGKTRIPSGTFKIELRHSPKFTPRYGHQMLWLTDVPNFEFVLIHKGNNEDDTEGCILVGSGTYLDTIVGSKKAYDTLYPKVAMHINAGRPVYISIIDYDR